MANTNTVSPAEVQKFLSGVDYPATKDELIQAAEAQGADENVMDTLRRIPMDAFNSANDVSRGIDRISD